MLCRNRYVSILVTMYVYRNDASNPVFSAVDSILPMYTSCVYSKSTGCDVFKAHLAQANRYGKRWAVWVMLMATVPIDP